MPFDVRVGTQSLADAAAYLGLTPIPAADLAAHKQAELDKHPGSWLYRHRWVGQMVILWLSACCMTIVMFSGNILIGIASHGTTTLPETLMIFATMVMGCMGLFSVLYLSERKLKGPARWVEAIRSPVALSHSIPPTYVPPTILETAQRVIEAVPNSYAVIGELLQDTTVLDPYLVIRNDRTKEEIVIGIWDDTRVLRHA